MTDMETDFIYCRHKTPLGVKIEEITGAEQRTGAVWREMARQVWSENGRDGYRPMSHRADGSPVSEAEPDTRISVSHTEGCFVVATIPPTPEVEDLGAFSPRAALGVDVERADRGKALELRSRFLCESEMSLSGIDTVRGAMLAWTCKEALYKAALTPGLDWRADIRISSLPDPDSGAIGEATVRFPDGGSERFSLYSYITDGFMVTIALGVRAASFLKNRQK